MNEINYEKYMPLSEKFITSKGWVKSTWYGEHNINYIHKKFNLTDDSFYIEMSVRGEDVEIFEEDNQDRQCIFRGILKNNEDLEKIMGLLEFDFNDK